MKKMMMITLSLALILTAQIVFADPVQLFDYALYKVTTEHKNLPTDVYTVASTLTSYDSVKKSYTREIDVEVLAGIEQGQSSKNQETYSAVEMPNGGDFASVAKDCVISNGTPANITAMNTSFNACLYDAGGKTWMANVPFGLVKSVTSDSSTGEVTTKELIEFRFGAP